ncbi:MAG: hypothetical protein MJB57_04995, partial [Gemmatimonadetes bacterium]|nr:hypothetical protein [Gemmatimonadota bacterium]
MSAKPFVSTVLGLLALNACGGDPTGVSASLCQVRNGAEVCVDRSEYRPGDAVRIRIRNVGSVAIFKDSCSTKAVGKTSEIADFEERFDPSLRCGPGADAADIVANMVEIAPGETFEET